MFDVLVVGGGINGAVTSAALAGRGASVALIDRGDFGHFTSQESSNLVWGGFKYLENYEFLLVFKLCRSRNRLMKAYPDNIKEISFLASLDRTSPYPPWFAGLGALGYWIIGQFGTRYPRLLSTEKIRDEEPVINTTSVRGGIEYRDAYLIDNDCRFVFSFVRSALEAGATAANYVELVSAERVGDKWVAQLRDVDSGEEFTTSAKVLVNAAGPFVDALNSGWGTRTEHRIVYSKGIHLVVPRLTTDDHRRVLAFFDDTQRLFYVIPMGSRSVIGTTDTRVDEPFSDVNDDDRDFLLQQINARLALEKPLTRADIIAERCGVRPLVVSAGGADQREVDWTSLSRKHAVETDRRARLVTVFGGKLTDCLNVGEELCDIAQRLGVAISHPTRRWYGEPGADLREEFFHQAERMELDGMTSPRSSEKLTTRLWRRYGRQAFWLLETIRADPRMADVLIEGAEYLRCEIELAARREMVTKLDDFLRRRSKIALVISHEATMKAPGLMEACRILFGDQAEAKLDEYLRERTVKAPQSA